jgi:hypothetical protein
MKRAQIFDVSMVFVVLGAMIAVLLVVNTIASNTSQWETIGQRAFELQNAYTQADYFVEYMSSSARWASAQTANILGDKGGFVTLPCGESNTFAFWNKKDNPSTTCFPQAYENFYAGLGTRMNKYAALYTKDRIITIAGKDIKVSPKVFDMPYEFVAVDGKLLGIATKPVYINILSPPEEFKEDNPGDWSRLLSLDLWTITYKFEPAITGTYFFRPNFEINFNYNLGVYTALTSAVQDIVTSCRVLADTAEKKKCANSKIEAALSSVNEKPSTVVIDNSGDIYYFTISQDSRKTIYLNDNAPEIRFALALPAPSIASVP